LYPLGLGCSQDTLTGADGAAPLDGTAPRENADPAPELDGGA
jgi:hypothetical protein